MGHVRAAAWFPQLPRGGEQTVRSQVPGDRHVRCVCAAGIATLLIRYGDLLRVDGTSGTVIILGTSDA